MLHITKEAATRAIIQERAELIAIIEGGLCKLAPCEHVACFVKQELATLIKLRGVP